MAESLTLALSSKVPGADPVSPPSCLVRLHLESEVTWGT